MIIAERLRHLFAYDPATGDFTRARIIDARFRVGQVVGHTASNGYLKFSIDGNKYYAHRLAWLYVHGEWPAGDIDHIDGNRQNNRLANLRDVNRSVNLQNLKGAKRHNKASGRLGVYPSGSRFTSRIQTNGRDKHLGSFATADEASAAYIKAKRELHEGNTL